MGSAVAGAFKIAGRQSEIFIARNSLRQVGRGTEKQRQHRFAARDRSQSGIVCRGENPRPPRVAPVTGHLVIDDPIEQRLFFDIGQNLRCPANSIFLGRTAIECGVAPSGNSPWVLWKLNRAKGNCPQVVCSVGTEFSDQVLPWSSSWS